MKGNWRTVVGIDPGLNGGMACLSDDGLVVEPMPVIKAAGKRTLNSNMIREWIEFWAPGHLIIERQQAMPKQGSVSTGKTMLNYGILLGIAVGLKIPYTCPRPVDWKRNLGVKADKDQARLIAGQLFPDNARDWPLRGDDGLAEAALIAEYGRRRLALDRIKLEEEAA